MNFKETIAVNEPLSDLIDTLSNSYEIPIDTLRSICELMFDTGVHEQRLAMLEAKLSGD